MITRILSVFRLLKRVGFAVLLLGGIVFAQPFEVLWDRSGQGPESGYGASVFSLGDQNNDGFMDWGVNASGNIAGDPSEAMGEFFYGGNPPQTTPYHVWRADTAIYLRYLFAEPVGDLNADGFLDWQINLWPRDTQIQRIEIYLGGPDATFNPALVLHLPISQSRLEGMGDFDGDGFDDMYIRDPDNLPHSRVLFGDVVLDSVPDIVTNEFIRAFPFGDLNGDGYADFIDTDENVYMGSATPDLLPEYHWGGGETGSIVRIVPDINGDWKADLAASDGNIAGHINVFFGSEVLSSEPNATIEYGDGCPSGGLDEIVGLGDINDDWRNDFAVLQRNCFNSWGGISIFLGYNWINPDPIAFIRGRTQPYNLVGIFSAAGLGDVDGNGVGDFAIGAWNDDFDGERGRVVVLSGDTSYVVPVGAARAELPNEINLSAYPNPFNASTRISFTLPPHVLGARLRVHNLLGREVMSQQFGAPAAGAAAMEYVFDGAGLPTGVYLVSVQAGEVVKTVKVMLVK